MKMSTEKLYITDEQDLRSLIRSEVKNAVEGLIVQAAAPSPPRRYSQRQASKKYNVSEPTLIKWRREGKIDHDEINGRIFYTDRHIEDAFQRSGREPNK